MNPQYKKIDVEPFNIWMRERIGKVLKPEHAHSAAGMIAQMLASSEQYHDQIAALADQYVYHQGSSSKICAEYLIGQIQRKAEERKKKIYDKK